MIIVTGGAGFIGSNLVKALNQRGETDILVVDNLTQGQKALNLNDCIIADYLDKEVFVQRIEQRRWPSQVDQVFHLGACSATTEWDGRYMMQNNFNYTCSLFNWCQNQHIPLVYASSASVYGAGREFAEDPAYERPLNVYGYSKLVFDQYLRRHLAHLTAPVVGLRYFNVYGPREQHKGTMASVAFHFSKQIAAAGRVRLFAGCDGYADGEQQRDFVSVQDCVAVKLWFLEHPEVSGIFNVGTGQARSFNAMAAAVIAAWGHGEIEYIPFPEHLQGRYQSYTQADIAALRAVGCDIRFASVEQGVADYVSVLRQGELSSADTHQ